METDMPKRLKIHQAIAVADEIRHTLSATSQGRFFLRLNIVLLASQDIPINTLSSVYQISSTTIQRWIHKLNAGGIDGLRELPGRGRRAGLSIEERGRLYDDLGRSPRDLGYDQSKWTGQLLSCHLEKAFGVRLRSRQCQNILNDHKKRGSV